LPVIVVSPAAAESDEVLAWVRAGANYGSETHVRTEREQADKKRATKDLFISALPHDLPDVHPS